jgi:hypothetical protein
VRIVGPKHFRQQPSIQKGHAKLHTFKYCLRKKKSVAISFLKRSAYALCVGETHSWRLYKIPLKTLARISSLRIARFWMPELGTTFLGTSETAFEELYIFHSVHCNSKVTM